MFRTIILLVTVCVVATQVDNQLQQHTCPPANEDQYIFRMLTEDVTVDPIPSLEQVLQDLQESPPEIQKFLQNLDQNAESISLKLPDNSSGIISPFINRCCPSPTFNCTPVRIPLFFLRYFGSMCFILYPVEKYFYARCTCSQCLVPGSCPLVGRCVESSWRFVKVVAYCPSHIVYFVKILIKIPTECNCLQQCPPVWSNISSIAR